MNSSTNPEGLHNSSEDQERLNNGGGQEDTQDNNEDKKSVNPEGIASLDQSDFSTDHTRKHKPLGDSHEPGTVPGADL
ncbi:hypothetical protein [Pedobacter sp. SYP-B3415]|uniref:hypothetical protein n=1 Tax=Pedobacter sp. SYP-B3415 TaxID=2496641 RepID=UPI00101DC822|nr:hypothetical protein [Pedobacter sp. SYP-B3415]